MVDTIRIICYNYNMISALEKGKYTIDRKEDVITSSFFDYLFLLPDEMVWDIIRTSCYDNKDLPEKEKVGEIKEIVFWPSWDSEGTGNEKEVVPDLFICFEHLHLIIEAKCEMNMQNTEQWKKEYMAYENVYSPSNKDVDVYLIALDGISDNVKKQKCEISKKKHFYVIKTRWQMLYETVLKYRQNRDEYFKQYDMIKRYLEYFGIYKIIWPDKIRWQNNKFNFNANMENLSRTYNDFLVEKDDIDKIRFMDILLKDAVGISNFIYDMKILSNMRKEYD